MELGQIIALIKSFTSGLKTEITSAEEDVNYLKDVREHTVIVRKPKNIYDGEYTEHGYIGQTDGVVYASPSSTSSYTDFYSIIDSNGKITISCQIDLKSSSFRYVLYDENKEYISGHLIANGDMSVSGGRYYLTIDTTGATYFRFSAKTTDIALFTSTAKFMIENGDGPTTYEAWFEPVYKVLTGFNEEFKITDSMTASSVPQKDIGFSMTDGTIKSLETNNVKKNIDLLFFGKITTFSGLWIGHGTGSNGFYMVIDGTNITPTTNGSSGSAVAHGLTIEDYISVELKVGTLGKCSVRVNTKSGTYTKDFPSGFTGTKGDIFVKSDGSTITDCSFSWVCQDYKKRTWVFGDSYLGTTSNKRWPYWMLTWGHDNAFMSGYAGENSENAYADFIQALTHGTPKYLIWCLGMNDADSASAISTNYKTYVELVMAKCAELGITLILATIPDTTTSPGSNDYKNAYVRASSYRFIDFADAVDGITGWLDTDGTHPNEVGARLLCSVALAEAPELMLEN